MKKNQNKIKILVFVLFMAFFFNRLSDGVKEFFAKQVPYQDSPAIVQIINISNHHHLESFNLSEKVKSDAWLFQQLLFQLWPIKMEPLSQWKIFLSQEDIGSCRVIEKQPEVTLAQCE